MGPPGRPLIAGPLPGSGALHRCNEFRIKHSHVVKNDLDRYHLFWWKDINKAVSGYWTATSKTNLIFFQSVFCQLRDYDMNLNKNSGGTGTGWFGRKRYRHLNQTEMLYNTGIIMKKRSSRSPSCAVPFLGRFMYKCLVAILVYKKSNHFNHLRFSNWCTS